MKIFEYQAMSLFAQYDIPRIDGAVADNSNKVLAAAKNIEGPVVIKAQVLTGGRGKAGGIKRAQTPDEAKTKAHDILSLTIKSMPVKKVLVVKAVNIAKEYYLSITIDRNIKKIVFIGSSAGGVDIEELARKEPAKIHTRGINQLTGLSEPELQRFAQTIFEDSALIGQAIAIMKKMYQLFIEKDCSLVEINPLVKTHDNMLVAVDAKIIIDDNGVYKHPDIESLRNFEEYSSEEIEARETGLSYVSMNGIIGCIVNGAGLAMATMDIIKLFGGTPANFLDVGGSSNPAKVLNAFKIILSNNKVKAILINIFGGITRCDDIAKGIILSSEQIEIPVPLIIRLVGTNEIEARQMLKQRGFEACEKMTDAIEKVVALTRDK